MKLFRVMLIAAGSLALGLLLGRSAHPPGTATERLTIGSAYGACSVVQDAVQHQWLTNEQGAALFAAYAARLQVLTRDSGSQKYASRDLANCDKEIVRFQENVGRP